MSNFKTAHVKEHLEKLRNDFKEIQDDMTNSMKRMSIMFVQLDIIRQSIDDTIAKLNTERLYYDDTKQTVSMACSTNASQDNGPLDITSVRVDSIL